MDAFIKQTYDQDWSDEEIAAPFHSVHSGTVIPPVIAVLPQVPEAEALLGAKASECVAIMRSGFPAADSELNYRSSSWTSILRRTRRLFWRQIANWMASCSYKMRKVVTGSRNKSL